MSCRLLFFPLIALALAAPAARADHPTAGIGGGGAGPINTVSADTLPAGMWGLSLDMQLINLKRISDAELEQFASNDIDAHGTKEVVVSSISVGCGITDDFTVGARLPHVSIHDVREGEMDMGVPEAVRLGDSEGLGDITLFGQYRLARETDEAPAWAVLGGLKLPTGADREHTSEGTLFETEHQPGSGSIDPLLGVAVTRHWGRHGLSANLLYTLATDGSQDTNMGDVIQYNVGWAYRFGGEEPHEHGEPDGHDHGAAAAGDAAAASAHDSTHDHTHDHAHDHAPHDEATTWDLVLELNGVRREEQTIDGVRNTNSGGNRLFLAPGVRVNVGGRWSAFASVGVPLFEHVNGAEHETDTRTVVGVSFAF